MSRADEVAQKIREVADHPRASLLFAVGAECPSPQSAASEAYALGLTNKEEKLAKWVAILKRDAEELFGKPFLEALRDILKEGENEMEVKRGEGFFFEKAQPLFRKLVEDILRTGVVFTHTERTLDILMEDRFYAFEIDAYALRVKTTDVVDGEKHKYTFSTEVVRVHYHYTFKHFTDEGFSNLYLKVSDQRVMDSVKRFARAWEAKSKQLKGGRPAKVTIFQDYA